MSVAVESPVLFRTEPTISGYRIGIATLNRPRQLNALDLEMCELMLAQFTRWAADPSIVCVMLDGAGDKGFCAGGDVAGVVRHLRGLAGTEGDARYVYGDTFFRVEYELDLLIHRYPKPFVAVSHGVCMGGGLGLVAGASHRAFVQGSKIAMPEIHIGLFPDVGGGYFLNRMPAGVGALLALTGHVITAEDALDIGLADAVVADDTRTGLCAALQQCQWSGDGSRDKVVVTGVVRGFAVSTDHAPSGTLMTHAADIAQLATCDSAPACRDTLASLAAQEPYFATAARSLAQGSPTSACVTFEYLRRTRSLDVAAALELDLVLARQFQRRHDFSEGVRALLIDKDRAPKWSPADWSQVTPGMIAAHFQPL